MEKILVASNIGLWVVIILQTLLILALFRYLGLLLNRLPAQGLPLGKSAPRREVVDINGAEHVLGEGSSHHQVLIFTSPKCPWCEKLAPDIAPFASSLGPDYQLLLVLGDKTPVSEARSYAERLGGGAPLPLAIAPDLLESYGVPGTPYGMLIDKEGIVRTKGTTSTLTDLQTLIAIRPSG
jgi:methylamine dehydrogenase accessory protein MauD